MMVVAMDFFTVKIKPYNWMLVIWLKSGNSTIIFHLFYNKKRLGHITTFMKLFVTRNSGTNYIYRLCAFRAIHTSRCGYFFLLFASCWLQSLATLWLVNRRIGLHLFPARNTHMALTLVHDPQINIANVTCWS